MSESRPRRRVELHWQILVGMLVGAIGGLIARSVLTLDEGGNRSAQLDFIVKNIAEPLGQIFLRLIFMVVIPLVFCALTLAVAELGDLRKLGRLGLRTFLFTLILSSASVAIGLGAANLIRPGEKLSPEKRQELREQYGSETGPVTEQTKKAVDQAKKAKSLRDTLLDIIPRNPLQEMVGALDGSSPGGGMLAVMFFALAFGIALSFSPERSGPLIGVLQGVYDAVMTIIGFAMRLAPIGVAGLMFSLTAVLGWEILKTLGWYVATVLGALALHLVVVYSGVVSVFAGRNPRKFFSDISDAMLTAFATSSSNATLPTAIRVTEENLGVRSEVARFVLTVGSTANQNGTALYEGITVLFLAQVTGVELTMMQQVTVILMSVLAGVGTAGVPGGSLPLVILVMQSVGIRPEAIGIILGVDRLLDMCRTTLNVTGDIAVAACVDRSERRQGVGSLV
jgi:DAACS family dicarboxylate/amino acid:cation (Na+ or H+) symporter